MKWYKIECDHKFEKNIHFWTFRIKSTQAKFFFNFGAFFDCLCSRSYAISGHFSVIIGYLLNSTLTFCKWSAYMCTGCLTLKHIFLNWLTDRNMQARICLNVVLKFWDWDNWVSLTSFLKHYKFWPQQPPTEKVIEFTMIFHNSKKNPKH